MSETAIGIWAFNILLACLIAWACVELAGAIND